MYCIDRKERTIRVTTVNYRCWYLAMLIAAVINEDPSQSVDFAFILACSSLLTIRSIISPDPFTSLILPVSRSRISRTTDCCASYSSLRIGTIASLRCFFTEFCESGTSNFSELSLESSFLSMHSFFRSFFWAVFSFLSFFCSSRPFFFFSFLLCFFLDFFEDFLLSFLAPFLFFLATSASLPPFSVLTLPDSEESSIIPASGPSF
mmetsp:Transcript_51365/g.75161  ORF Transcript_51365/g.75161 Transcript_51365/m.75161 type:complete len:206 (-) Transcript_51365:17-634(-)